MDKIKDFFITKEFLAIIFLFLFSVLFNQYYGNRGAFPHDSFAHFETGFRILSGEHPFKNYWIISGPFIDYIQGLFFYLFGVNWKSYVFHASFFNGILTIITFLVFRSFKINTYYSFIYSFLFSILAYPSSGTPFVDHHSAFLSLLGIYCILLGIKDEKNLYWILFPVFFFCAFLSKQVPSAYIMIPIVPILCFYFFEQKKLKPILISFFTGAFLILFLFFFGLINGISLSSFIEQYILYPQSIGKGRIQNLMNISPLGVFGNFKFIFIILVILIYINIKGFLNFKKYYKKKELYYFLIIFFFTIALIFHQILTRNQIFIFFLIPFLAGFLHIYIKTTKKIFYYIIIIFCIFVTTKYHLRFNEGRKFHELINANLNIAVDAKKIDNKLLGLKWITPQYQENPEFEIKKINEIKNILKNDQRKKMVLSNYPFLSVILEQQFFSTTRWHVFDGTDYPQIGNKYLISYKNLFHKILLNNNIEVIYTISPVRNKNIYDYIDFNCFVEKELNENISSFTLKKCDDLNLS